MRRKIALLLLLLPLTLAVKAQRSILSELETYQAGQGQVHVFLDPSIEALVGKRIVVEKSSAAADVKRTGYRVLVYAGNNTRQSKNECAAIAREVEQEFPDLKVYTMFNPPRWLCKVGDFTSIEEADAMMRKLRQNGGFKEVTIVKDQITVTY